MGHPILWTVEQQIPLNDNKRTGNGKNKNEIQGSLRFVREVRGLRSR